MTQEQAKAKELVSKFLKNSRSDLYDEVFKAHKLRHGNEKGRISVFMDFSKKYHAKKCALIAIDEIINALKLTEKIQQHPIGVWKAQEYWQEVKQEIEKL
jgi:hypothetical protein